MLATCLLGLTACGEGDGNGDAGLDASNAMDAQVPRDAGPDAPAVDRDASADDASTVDLDAEPATDGGPPPVDAGPMDADEDGVDDAIDCDPSDAAVGRTGSRACTSTCGDGFELCSDGVWGACSAPTSCTCATAGERRIATCGMCGERSEECRDGMWEAVSACLSQGACPVGAVEEREEEYCARSQRLCGTTCEWGEWSLSTPRGECPVPGRRQCLCAEPFYFDSICTDTCMLIDNPDCPCVDAGMPDGGP